MGDAGQSPASAGARLEGVAFWETLKMTVDILDHMQEQARHASPLGRAHTEPVNPGEVGCDRPEGTLVPERAGFVT